MMVCWCMHIHVSIIMPLFWRKTSGSLSAYYNIVIYGNLIITNQNFMFLYDLTVPTGMLRFNPQTLMNF